MKVIFLDIDGVLNSKPFFDKNTGPGNLWSGSDLDMIDGKAVKLLSDFVEQTGANIVISSSWRIGHSVIHLQELLRGAGFKFPERIIGTTSSRTHKDRGYEIHLWLRQVPEVKDFVIFDDDSDMTGVQDHLVQTSFSTGLTAEDIEKARVILNAQKD